MNAIIFANGELSLPSNWAALHAAAELIIAVDGGAKHLFELELEADLVVGDLDSIAAAELAKLENAQVDILRFPSDKDQTDLELAILEAQKRGAKKISVLSGLGRRWDHSLANIMMAAQREFQDLMLEFLHGEQRLFLIREEIQILEKIGTRLSLIPLGGDARSVKTEGLRYTLDNEDVALGSSRGVSNVFAKEKVTISLEEGLLLCVLSPDDLN